ncbi:MAG TPA: peptidylprolyl isomerase, partial [Caulobacteraceae bacterium]
MKLAGWISCCIAALPGGAVAAPSLTEILDHSPPSDWRTVDPSRTLYMELPQGRVVIELAPGFAPNHAANI